MVTLSYFIEIQASPEKIWEVLWNPKTFSEWRGFFNPNASFQSDWKVGGQTRFLDSANSGLVSTISNLEESRFVTFNHLGILVNGVPETNTRLIKEWSGAPERYLLIPLEDDKIRLQVEVRDFRGMRDKMDDAYPKALELVKKMAENA